MIKPSFLVLTEGKNEVGWIARYIENMLRLYEPELEFKIIKDKKEEIISLKIDDDIIVIYIKKAINQNLKTFNEHIENNESFEKIYGLDELTAVFSIFDYDPGSTLDKQCIEYFKLKDKQENFYPIMTYPGYESQSLIEFHKGLYEKYSDILKEGHLHNIEEVLEYIKIDENEIRTSKIDDIATRMKKILRQLLRSKILKEPNTIEKYRRVLEYTYRQFNKTDYYYYLEKQEEIFEKIVLDDIIRVSSFLNCVIENILEWVRDEEED